MRRSACTARRTPHDDAGEGYVIADARWQNADGSWHDGANAPTCIGTDTGAFTHVRLGLAAVTGPDGTAWDQAAWSRCLE